MQASGTRARARWKSIPLVVACFAAGTTLANPVGLTVVHGQVTVQQSGNLLQVTNSPNAILNWQSFSIGANEITRFVQQSASSAVLNRVVGAAGTVDPSVILGTLQSNGRVFLVNPSGILFGAGARVDVAGLVASSLNLSNADFLAGRLRFNDAPGAGAVTNQGSIGTGSGGQVYLIGPAVTNSGIVSTPGGEVLLAAGKSVELVDPGTPNLRVEINAPDNEALNLGNIVARSGRIGIYAGLIRGNGVLNADSAVTGPAGEIVLKASQHINVVGKADAGVIRMDAGGSISIDTGGPVTVCSFVTCGPGGAATVLTVGNAGTGGVTVNGNAVILTSRPASNPSPVVVIPSDTADSALSTVAGPVVNSLWETMDVGDLARLLGPSFRARHAPRAQPAFE